MCTPTQYNNLERSSDIHSGNISNAYSLMGYTVGAIVDIWLLPSVTLHTERGYPTIRIRLYTFIIESVFNKHV